MDRSLGRKHVATALIAAGADVRIHDNHFDQAAPDAEWLTEVGQRGWIVLTKDDRIRYNPLERTAFRLAHVRAFIYSRGDASGQEMGSAFAAALTSMIAIVKLEPPPFTARVYPDGRVRMTTHAADWSEDDNA